jgi:hypothetical protein
MEASFADQQTAPNPPTATPPKKSNKAKIWFIVLALLLVASSSLAVYFFLQTQNNRDEVSSLNNRLTDTKKQLTTVQAKLDKVDNSTSTSSESSSESIATNNATSGIEYFTLSNWNIKFIMPKGLEKSDIIVQPQTSIKLGGIAQADVVSLNTKAAAALGGTCGNKDNDIITLLRTRTSVADAEIPNIVTLTYDKDENGYYYYETGRQSYCATTEANLAIEREQTALLQALTNNIQ